MLRKNKQTNKQWLEHPTNADRLWVINTLHNTHYPATKHKQKETYIILCEMHHLRATQSTCPTGPSDRGVVCRHNQNRLSTLTDRTVFVRCSACISNNYKHGKHWYAANILRLICSSFTAVCYSGYCNKKLFFSIFRIQIFWRSKLSRRKENYNWSCLSSSLKLKKPVIVTKCALTEAVNMLKSKCMPVWVFVYHLSK